MGLFDNLLGGGLSGVAGTAVKMNPLGLGIAGVGMVGGLIQKLFASGKQRRLANRIKVNDPTYKVSEYAKNNLGMALNAKNARMAGARQLEQNLLASQANAMANVNRNATSSSQALGMFAGLQGNTNSQMNRLAMLEAQNALALQQQVAAANQGMVREGDKVHADLVRKAQEAQAAKNALMQSSMTNQANIFKSIGNFGILAGLTDLSGLRKKEDEESILHPELVVRKTEVPYYPTTGRVGEGMNLSSWLNYYNLLNPKPPKTPPIGVGINPKPRYKNLFGG